MDNNFEVDLWIGTAEENVNDEIELDDYVNTKAELNLNKVWSRYEGQKYPEDSIFLGVTKSGSGDIGTLSFVVHISSVRAFITDLKRFEYNEGVGYKFREERHEKMASVFSDHCFMCSQIINSTDEFFSFPVLEIYSLCLHKQCVSKFENKIEELISTNRDNIFSEGI